MAERDGGGGTTEAGGDRASALAAAILGISEGLDLDTVLREIVEGARGLTEAQRGIVATFDESGQPGDYVFSGIAPDDERDLVEWSGGLAFLAHLHELPGPLSVEDLRLHVRGLGLEQPPAAFPSAFQGTPARYRGSSVGYLFPSGKVDGAAFTAADEEVLLLFAAQAGAGMWCSPTAHKVTRARMDLETLIETSPVGVVLFDSATGDMVSSNREARRIFESLRTPGRPIEELLETVVVQRADGSEGRSRSCRWRSDWRARRRCARRTSRCRCRTGAACGRWSTRRRCRAGGPRPPRCWWRCRTSRRWTSSSGCVRNSSGS